MLVYDIQTFNTDRFIPNSICIHKLSKTSGKNSRDATQRGYSKKVEMNVLFLKELIVLIKCWTTS